MWSDSPVRTHYAIDKLGMKKEDLTWANFDCEIEIALDLMTEQEGHAIIGKIALAAVRSQWVCVISKEPRHFRIGLSSGDLDKVHISSIPGVRIIKDVQLVKKPVAA